MRVQQSVFFRRAAAVLFFAASLHVAAQGTAFFYQGRLNVSGVPASTNYDFRFAVFTAVTNGSSVSQSLTNSAVPVSNGLFSVTLDFGPGVFKGSNYWLDIGVRAIGATSFTVLAPRQPILPVPYAIFATGASNLLGGLASTQLVGTVPPALIAGNFPGSVNFSNAANNFAGTFSGNGANLNSLNAGNIAGGTLADARLSSNVPLLNGSQTFSGANTFNGQITSTAANAFIGVNSFTNLGNSFSGSFFGNGLVGWLPTNSASFQAQVDHGYVLTSAQLTTVTLPASPNVGDIVRIAGAGAGGWLVKINSGQSIIGNFASYSNVVLAQLSSSDCYGAAGSADGAQVLYSPSVGGGVDVYFTSGLGPGSFVSPSSGTYLSIACSANGKIIYAEPTGSGSIVKSTDGGSTWPVTAGTANGFAIACSADGGTLFTGNVACSGSGKYVAKWSGTTITISNFFAGTSATATAPATPTCLGVSSDCTKLLIGGNNGLLYASANQGKTWAALTSSSQSWSSVWMSQDGSKFGGSVNSNGGGTGGVYYCNVSALPNTSTSAYPNGGIGGSQGSAVELQYIGNNQFMPVSSTGLIWAN